MMIWFIYILTFKLLFYDIFSQIVMQKFLPLKGKRRSLYMLNEILNLEKRLLMIIRYIFT
jgi:hypothetical protein